MHTKVAIALVILSLSLLLSIFSVSAKSSHISEIRDEFVRGEIIIKMKPPSAISGFRTLSESQLNDINSLSINSARKLTKTDFNVKNIEKLPILNGTYVIKFNSEENMDKILEEYANNANVEYAEPNYIYHLFSIANDTYRDQQWSLDIANLTSAWDIERGNKSIIIAIIDTGIEYNHTDLSENIWNNTDEIPSNGIDDDGNGYIDDIRGWNFYSNSSNPMDDNGHGTHIAGIASAVSNNSKGVAGVCWNCLMMPIKAGSSTTIYSANASLGVIYAADNGAKVISMSFGSQSGSSTLKNALNYAYEKGAVLVASAGNTPQIPAGVKVYPAAYENVISVSATNATDKKASYSQYGSWIDVAAPGGDGDDSSSAILSTYIGNDYGTGKGTSMSAPFVSGLIGLILSKNPSLNQEQVRTILHSTTENVSSSYYIGTGRVNAFYAVTRNQTVIASLNGSLDDANVSGVIKINGTANGTDLVNYTIYYGLGIYPNSWSEINFSNQNTSNSVLTTWDTSSVSDGTYSILLVVIDYLNQSSIDKLILYTDNDMHIFSQNIDSCRNLNQSNEIYNLTANASSAGTCMNITANNVTLDCNGFMINYSQSATGYAINNTGYNYTVIKNCIIVQDMNSSSSYAIYFNGANNGTIINNTIFTNGSSCSGAYLYYGSNYNNVTNNSIYTKGQYGTGILLDTVSNYNILINNTIYTNGTSGRGIYLYDNSNYNGLYLNTISTNNTDGDGIYIIFSSNSTLYNNTIYTKGQYGHGILVEYSSNYNNLTSNNIFINGSSGRGIYIFNSSNPIIYGNSISTDGSDGYGIYIYSSNYSSSASNIISTKDQYGHGIYIFNNSYYNNISNNSISINGSSGRGIYISDNSNYNNLSENIISTNSTDGYGIQLYSSSESNIYNNNISTNGSSSHSIYINSNSNYNNLFSNKIISKQSYGIYFANSTNIIPSNNTIYNNLINGSIWPAGFSQNFPVGAIGINYWNTTNQTGTRTYATGKRIGGNYYTNSTGNGFSDTCTDADGDGFCDSSYNVIDNIYCSGSGCGNNTDYLALSGKYGAIPPTINYSISSPVVINGTNVTIIASTSNIYIDIIWVNITLPDSTSTRINLTNNTQQNFNATLNGTYYAVFFANNTFGNISNVSASFIAQPPVNFALNITNTSSGVTNVNVTVYFNGSIVTSNSTSNGSLLIPIANYTFNISFEPYNKSFKIILNDVNLSQNNSLSIGFDKPVVSGYITAYAVNYNHTMPQNANVTINYTSTGYTNENYLSIYKCDNWNFTNRSCPSGGWVNITSSSVKNTTAHSFVASVGSFSGFAIWQDSFCGNLVCENTETCSNCPGDCGSCSQTPGSGSQSPIGTATTTTTVTNTTTTSTIENIDTTTTFIADVTTTTNEPNITSSQIVENQQIDFTPMIVMLILLSIGAGVIYVLRNNTLSKYMENILSNKSSLYSDMILLEKNMIILKNSGHDVSKIENEVALAKRAIESEAFPAAKIHMENARGMMKAYN